MLAAVGGQNDTLLLWSAVAGEPLATGQLGDLMPTIAFAPSGSQLAIGARNGVVWLTRPSTGKPVAIAQRNSAIRSVEFSPDGSKILACSNDQTASIFNVADGSMVVPALQHTARVNLGGFSADGKWVVTADDMEKTRVWSAEDGMLLVPPLNGKVWLGIDSMIVYDKPHVQRILLTPGSRANGQAAEQAEIVTSHAFDALGNIVPLSAQKCREYQMKCVPTETVQPGGR